jgi:hypothetical protein
MDELDVVLEVMLSLKLVLCEFALKASPTLNANTGFICLLYMMVKGAAGLLKIRALKPISFFFPSP